jgi:flagellar assembly protein FliH
MNESVISVRKKLRGIKYHDTYNSKPYASTPTEDGTREKPSSSQIVDDARKIKHLEDRIKILEIELQKAREESFQGGYDEGKQRTLQDAQNRIEAVRLEMKQQELQFRETMEQMEKPLLELAKIMAKEVILQEIQSNADTDFILLERLRKMLNELVDQNNIIIEVNQQHLNMLKSTDIKKKLGIDEQSDVRIISSKSLGPAEVNIETENYFIDGTFENHINKIHAEFAKGKDE